MKKTNRFITGLSALAVVISAGLTASPAFAAAPNTCLWTGATNTTFSTATNWSSCGGVAPQAGDTIAFDNAATGATLTNDLGVALGGLQLLGGGAASQTYIIDNLTFAPGATIAHMSGATPSTSVSLTGTLTGQGDLNLTSTGSGFTFGSGVWNVNGTVTAPIAPFFTNLTGGTLSINSGAAFLGTAINGATNVTNESFIVTTGASGDLTFANQTSGGTQNYTATGAVTLNDDQQVCAVSGSTVTFTGVLTTNGHKIIDAACGGTVNFNWSQVIVPAAGASSGSGTTTAPKAPNTGNTGVSQANIAAPILGAILVAAGIISVRQLATRKR